jgi:hypothetical protein
MADRRDPATALQSRTPHTGERAYTVPRAPTYRRCTRDTLRCTPVYVALYGRCTLDRWKHKTVVRAASYVLCTRLQDRDIPVHRPGERCEVVSRHA